MKFYQDQIEFAASQIGYIDSGEKGVFLDTVNTENQIEAKIFHNGGMAGVFYSCVIFGGLRMHISFETDTGEFNEDLAICVQSALKKADMASCSIWIFNEDKKIIRFLKERFRIAPEGAHDYASIEYIMRRERFDRTADQSVLKIRSYEEDHIDDYLILLDGSMTFVDPPPNFLGGKGHWLQCFAERANDNSFEAFWKRDRLVGLYWRKNAEIDILAVGMEHQRKGYGSIILTRAIDMVFKNTDADFAYLYAVNWNVKGQSFFQKYGMVQNGHSYLLKIYNYDDGR